MTDKLEALVDALIEQWRPSARYGGDPAPLPEHIEARAALIEYVRGIERERDTTAETLVVSTQVTGALRAERDGLRATLQAEWGDGYWRGRDDCEQGYVHAWRQALEIPGPAPGKTGEPLEGLVRRTEALRADSERYKWLRENGYLKWNMPSSAMLDAAIDAGRGK